jgi:hypothetical protein
MAGIVLALAGLTAGDGGPGMGAARVEVAVKFGDGFKGFIRLPGGPLRNVELRGEALIISGPLGTTGHSPASFTMEGKGRFRLACRRVAVRGGIHHEGGQIVLTLERPNPEPDHVD